MFKSSYTLFNYITVSNMLRSYGVKINFSGHLHIQSIKENQGLYDIASNSLLAYGNRYGVLDIYQNCYEYNAKKLDFIDENIDLEQISFNNFYNKYYEKSYIHTILDVPNQNNHYLIIQK